MSQLPKPTTEWEMEERLDDLDAVIACSDWEGEVVTPGMQALLSRYALGEIGETEFRAQLEDVLSKPRLDLCH